LHDEINTLQLELGQLEERNAILNKDNAKLLQRWLDTKQAEANQVNEANDFYEEMRSQKQAVVNWRDGPPDPAAMAGAAALQDALDDETMHAPLSGMPSAGSLANGSGKAEHPSAMAGTMMGDGMRSQNPKAVGLTPNG
jgi:autophagy-related protein 16